MRAGQANKRLYFVARRKSDFTTRNPDPHVAKLPPPGSFDGVVTSGRVQKAGSRRRKGVRMPLEKSNGHQPDRRGAFSLLELITVIAIIVIMLSLLAPAINSMTSTAGRKGALNILMNTFEQARAAALESGANVYVVLWQRQFPDNDRIIVLRDAVEWNKNEKPQFDSGDKVPLTRYIQMPRGVLLYRGKGKSILSTSPPNGETSELDELLKQLPKSGGVAPQKSEIGYVKFSPTGTIQYPASKDYSRVIISEGVRGTGGTEAILAGRKEKQGGLEIITFRRFTGRASVDVSTLD